MSNGVRGMQKVHFSAGGISLVIKDLSDLIKDRIQGINEIYVNTSSHPNSSPHLGTLTTLMVAFNLARKFQDDFQIPAKVEFDELENSPYRAVEGNYFTSLGEMENGKTVAEKYMEVYISIFNKLSILSDIPYIIRTYSEYQKIAVVRRTVMEIYRLYDTFRKLLDPSEEKLFLRTKCPICGISNRDTTSFQFEKVNKHLIFHSDCCLHGEYKIIFSIENNAYIDMNSQLRDLTKGVLISDQRKRDKRLIIMCDGRDWSGEWALRMHVQGMQRLGYSEITTRFFTPTIVDWSGGKYSKSVYLKHPNYSGFEAIAANYNELYRVFGEKGFMVIYEEVKSWVRDPVKFFRNYSNEYFRQLLESME